MMIKFLLVLTLVMTLCPLFGEVSFWYPTTGPEALRILVPGTPPLTVGKQNVLFNCVEFGLSVALTQKEQETLRTAVMEEYLTHKGNLLTDLGELEKLWNEVMAASPADQAKYRQVLKDSLMAEAKKAPNIGISKMIAEILSNSSETIVGGGQKIDKRSFNAFLELVEMCLKMRDKRIVQWSTTERLELEAVLIRHIPELSPEGRKWLGNADFHRTIIFRNWQQVPPDERETVKKFLVETFAPNPKPGSTHAVDLESIPIPPPNLFPLPMHLPWEMR